MAVYLVYGLACAFLFVVLIRSVTGDLYGKPRALSGPQQAATACLEDLHRLYDQLSARAVQPAPRGLESDGLAREWDAWQRRWDDDIERLSVRCQLATSQDPAAPHLTEALDGMEELRRRLARSGKDAAADARRVKEALAAARTLLKLE